MKCPHCLKPSKAKVLESRRAGTDVWRKRLCSVCLQSFVTQEVASVDKKFPWEKVHRERGRVPAPRTGAEEKKIVSTGRDLQEIWGFRK